MLKSLLFIISIFALTAIIYVTSSNITYEDKGAIIAFLDKDPVFASDIKYYQEISKNKIIDQDKILEDQLLSKLARNDKVFQKDLKLEISYQDTNNLSFLEIFFFLKQDYIKIRKQNAKYHSVIVSKYLEFLKNKYNDEIWKNIKNNSLNYPLNSFIINLSISLNEDIKSKIADNKFNLSNISEQDIISYEIINNTFPLEEDFLFPDFDDSNDIALLSIPFYNIDLIAKKYAKEIVDIQTKILLEKSLIKNKERIKYASKTNIIEP